MGLFLGIDTSCYTTSVACVDEKGIVYEKRTVLSVKLGQRGLRQSEGLFQHVRNLESLLPGMLACLDRKRIPICRYFWQAAWPLLPWAQDWV